MVKFITQEDVSIIECYRMIFYRINEFAYRKSVVKCYDEFPQYEFSDVVYTKCAITAHLYAAALGGVLGDVQNPIIQPGKAYLVNFDRNDHVCILIAGYDKYQLLHSYILNFATSAHFIDPIAPDKFLDWKLNFLRKPENPRWNEIICDDLPIKVRMKKFLIFFFDFKIVQI